jgi:hypothetical protein
MFLLDEEQESKEGKGEKQGEKQSDITSGHPTLGLLLVCFKSRPSNRSKKIDALYSHV